MNCKSAGSSAGHCWLLKCQPPPGENNNDNNTSVWAALFLSMWSYLNFSNVSKYFVRGCFFLQEVAVNHANMWSEVLQILGLVHPTFGVCPLCLLLQMKPSEHFSSERHETLEDSCCQITSLNNPLLFLPRFLGALPSFPPCLYFVS